MYYYISATDKSGQRTTENTYTFDFKSSKDTSRLAGPTITLPSDHIEESGSAVKVTVLLASENKINSVKFHQSKTPEFLAPMTLELSFLFERSDGHFVYTGLAPSVQGTKLYYYFSASDDNGQRTSMGSAVSPLTFR